MERIIKKGLIVLTVSILSVSNAYALSQKTKVSISWGQLHSCVDKAGDDYELAEKYEKEKERVYNSNGGNVSITIAGKASSKIESLEDCKKLFPKIK